MGEANRRKALDPSFGRPKRGLVVSPPLDIEGTSLIAKLSTLDPQELRAWVLFFDNLVWPSSRAIHFASGPDEQFLEQCGVLTRPDYTVWGDGAQGIAKGQINAFADLDTKEPGRWALAQGENSLLIRDRLLEPNHGLALEFYNSIPVPNRDVPLNEVLEFRLRRSDELELLRNELDGFVAAVNGAEDKVAELQKHLSTVDNACANAIRVSHEWQFPIRLTNLKASFEIRPFMNLAAGVAAFGVGTATGLTASAAALTAIGAAAAATAPALKLAGDFGWRGLKRRIGPYRYVYQFHQELF